MRFRVLYFAAVRDLVAKDEESVEAPDAVRTVRDFTSWVASHHPALDGRMRSVRIARNETFAREDELLSDGDTLALIPPVAGG